jgi:hypothetical protein
MKFSFIIVKSKVLLKDKDSDPWNSKIHKNPKNKYNLRENKKCKQTTTNVDRISINKKTNKEKIINKKTGLIQIPNRRIGVW